MESQQIERLRDTIVLIRDGSALARKQKPLPEQLD